MKNVGKRIAKGAIWMVLFKFTERGIGLVSTIILARLLVPEDFGIVAMAMSVVFAAELLNAFSFDVVLVQKQDTTRKHFDTAWTFQVLFGSFSCALLFLLAPALASYFGEPEVEFVIYLLALGSVADGLTNIGTVEFRKQMLFGKEFQLLASKKVIGFVVTVPLAFYLGNYWALVIGMLAARCGGVLVSYLMHPFRPRLSLAAARELFSFSFWLFLSNMTLFLRMRSADFVLGRVVGANGLGLFSVSHEIAVLPTTELVQPINRAVFSGYSRISHDLKQLSEQYLNVLGLVALLALPAGGGIAAVAHLLIPVFLGPKWLDAIPIIEVLALYGMMTAMLTNIGSAYLALGRPRVLTWLGIANVAVLLPLLIFLAQRDGYMGAAWAYLLTTLALMPVYYTMILTTLKIRVSAFLRSVWRPLCATAVMFFLVREYGPGYEPQAAFAANALSLLESVAIGAVSYSLCVLLLWLLAARPAGAERFVLDVVRPRLRLLLRSG